MTVLVFGASGMLGHKVMQVFAEHNLDAIGVMRGLTTDLQQKIPILKQAFLIGGNDVRNQDDVLSVFKKIKPKIIVNCAGIVKPRATDPVETIEINSAFPHRIARLSSMIGARLIHISTDCVFSGNSGDYFEDSPADCADLYGRSKLIGEVDYDDHLTIRTSIIGRELGTSRNLLEWFFAQEGDIKGFDNAFFTGVSTRALAEIIVTLCNKPEVTGLLHVPGTKVNKYDLLCQVKEAFRTKVRIERYSGYKIDRSLASKRIHSLGIIIPTMETMIKDMAQENSMYESLAIHQ